MNLVSINGPNTKKLQAAIEDEPDVIDEAVEKLYEKLNKLIYEAFDQLLPNVDMDDDDYALIKKRILKQFD